jgi:hypothetical protein
VHARARHSCTELYVSSQPTTWHCGTRRAREIARDFGREKNEAFPVRSVETERARTHRQKKNDAIGRTALTAARREGSVESRGDGAVESRGGRRAARARGRGWRRDGEGDAPHARSALSCVSGRLLSAPPARRLSSTWRRWGACCDADAGGWLSRAAETRGINPGSRAGKAAGARRVERAVRLLGNDDEIRRADHARRAATCRSARRSSAPPPVFLFTCARVPRPCFCFRVFARLKKWGEWKYHLFICGFSRLRTLSQKSYAVTVTNVRLSLQIPVSF